MDLNGLTCGASEGEKKQPDSISVTEASPDEMLRAGKRLCTVIFATSAGHS